MSSNDHRIRTAVAGAGWLAPHRDVFVEGLGKHGYAPSTIRYYRCAINTFCAEIDTRGLGAEALEWPVLAELGITVPGEMTSKERSRWRSCVRRFLDHLVDAGVLAPPPPVAPPKRFTLTMRSGGAITNTHRRTDPSVLMAPNTGKREEKRIEPDDELEARLHVGPSDHPEIEKDTVLAAGAGSRRGSGSVQMGSCRYGMITWKGRYVRFRLGKGTGCSLRARSVPNALASSRVCW